MKKELFRAVPLALALISFLVAPLAAEPAASAATPQSLAQALGLKAPCAAAGAENLHRMAWWPDLCGACSSSPQCVGLLVLDVRPCDPGDGSRGICVSTGNYCPDSDPDDNRDEVSCYCDWYM